MEIIFIINVIHKIPVKCLKYDNKSLKLLSVNEVKSLFLA